MKNWSLKVWNYIIGIIKAYSIIAGTVFALILIVGAFFIVRGVKQRHEFEKVKLLAEHKLKSNKILDEFFDQEKSVGKEYIGAKIGIIWDKEYSDLYKNCDELEEYNKLTEMDTRDMSIKQLDRAIELNGVCNNDLERMSYGWREMDSEISELFSKSSLIEDSGKKEKAKQISNYWRQILVLAREKHNLLEQEAQMQKDYWEVEKENMSNKSTMATRNKEFQRLNDEIKIKNEKIENLNIEIDNILSKKNDLLSEFKTEAY